jgi:hypothetical protein
MGRSQSVVVTAIVPEVIDEAITGWEKVLPGEAAGLAAGDAAISW